MSWQTYKQKIEERRKKEAGYVLILLAGLFIGIAMGMFLLLLSPIGPTLNCRSQIANILKGDIQGFKEASFEQNCKGILAFYTGTNFTSDSETMKRRYSLIYDSEDGNGIGSSIRLLPPLAIISNSKNYDCEDIAHGLLCLASMYPNVDCHVYYWFRDDDNAHIGVECDETLGHFIYRTTS